MGRQLTGKALGAKGGAIEDQSRARELVGKGGHIETHIVGNHYAAFGQRLKGTHHIFEEGCSREHVVINTRELPDEMGNPLPRIHQGVPTQALVRAIEGKNSHLHHASVGRVAAGGLNVQYGKAKPFHGAVIRKRQGRGSSHRYLVGSACYLAAAVCYSHPAVIGAKDATGGPHPQMRSIYAFLFLKLAGWRIQDERPGPMARYIVVVAPHTSNWDFFVGLAVRSLADMSDAKYLAKSSLFKPPFGWIFRALGGYPVDRSKHTNMVDAVVAMFDSGEIRRIGITPEGTRKYQPNWKTGFHRIAMGAKVPIILCTFDYPKKLAVISAAFPLTNDPEADIARMKDWFRPHKGKNPEDGIR